LHTALQLPLIITYIGSSNASVASNIQVVTKCNHHLLDLKETKK
jgi:hypothetical protein